MRQTLLVFLVNGSMLAGCSSETPVSPAPTDRAREALPSTAAIRAETAREPAEEEPQVIVTLELRAHRVHVLAGDRFSVEDHNGRLLAGNLTKPDFAEQFPALHRATEDALLTAEADTSATRAD